MYQFLILILLYQTAIQEIEGEEKSKPKEKSHLKKIVKPTMQTDRILYNDPASMEVVDSEIPPNEFPYQVSLRVLPGFQHFCAGAIISPRHVVTVANCFCSEEVIKLQIVVTAGMVGSKDAKSWNVRRKICHPLYNRTERFHDIALLSISGSFQFSDTLKMIEMVNYPSEMSDLNVRISDWDEHQVLGRPVPHIQYINTKTIAIDICRNMINILSLFDYNKTKSMGRSVMNWNICTFDFGALSQRACSGDSGAPVVYNDQLLALESWADECYIDIPGVHTSIPFHYLWINNECEKDSFFNFRYAMYLNKFRNIY